MKACPFCAEQIQDAATKCRFCGEMLPGAPAAAGGTPTAAGPGNAKTAKPKRVVTVGEWVILVLALLALVGVAIKIGQSALAK